MTPKLLLLIVALANAPSSLLAQTATEVFMRLWTDHIDICGPLLEEPLAVLDERVAPPGFQSVLWFGTEDRTDVTVNYASESFEWNALVEVRTSTTQMSFHCNVRYSSLDGIWPFATQPETLDSVFDLVDRTPQLTASGGLVDGLTEEDDVSAFIYDASIVISGAFPNYPNAISRVAIHAGGMTVQVDAFLDRNP